MPRVLLESQVRWSKRAYDLMRSGTPINLVGVPGGTINNPSIALDTFVQQYVGALRHLLPNYAALDPRRWTV